jgi:acylphosphatase
MYKLMLSLEGVCFRYANSQGLGFESKQFANTFSDFTVQQAKGLGLTGYVQNARDGTVVGEAQGSEDDLKKLATHLNKGPPAASVENVEQKEISTKSGETGFGQH